MNPNQLWQAALGELELLLSKANFTTWFKNTFIAELDGRRVVVGVPNGFTKAWLESKYHQAIVKALHHASNKTIEVVEYRVEAQRRGEEPAQDRVVDAPTTTVAHPPHPTQSNWS